MFRDRAFSAAIIDAGLMTFGMYALLFIFPLYLQSVRGQSAVGAGVQLLPMSVTFFVVSLFAERLMQWAGTKRLIATGMSLTGGGIFELAYANSRSSYTFLTLGLLAIGVGLGLITGPIMNAAVSRVPREKSGMSSGLVNVGRMVGATLGVAILGSIFGAHMDQAARNTPEFLSGMHKALAIGGGGEVAGAGIALAFLQRGPREKANSE